MRPEGVITTGLLDWINAIPADARGWLAQIGVWRGDATVLFAPAFKFVVDIDPWRGDTGESYSMDDVYSYYIFRCDGISNVTSIRKTSAEALPEFHDGTFDAGYIDAQHTRDGVYKNIQELLPKIKKGGYIGGHDYGPYFPGVAEAVHEYFAPERIQVFQDTSWLIKL